MNPTAAADRPNILWVCTDQQRFDTIARLGNPAIRTPNLDRLVDRGTAFTHAYVQSTVCTPSRASFMTGMYPSTIHNCMNGTDRFSDAAPLISNYLRDAGYHCGLVGKLHLAAFHGRDEEPRPADDGFAHFVLQNGAQADWCTDESLRFLEQACAADGPWFLFASYVDPHPPFKAPDAYRALYPPENVPPAWFHESDLAQQKRFEAIDFESPCQPPDTFDLAEKKAHYYGMITRLDEHIGRMLAWLEDNGLAENTLVVFTSDHGDMMGDHGLIRKGCRFYEGLVRVPLVFAWPGRYEAGLRSDALVELTDIVPTLLDAAGVPVPEDMQGRSLGGICRGAAPPGEHRPYVRCEHYKSHWRGHYRGTWASMIRTRRWKQVSYHGHELGELYDLPADPREFHNLWDDPALAGVRFDLVRTNFDALAFAVDLGHKRVAVA
jgi:arylsulfatase A-like enzyme